jgi:thiol-disulfide isomerase/thioredoxin
MKKFLLSIIAGGFLALSSFGQSSVPLGSAAPTWTLTDVHGNTHDLAAITASGKWVVIDFFFTTCGPCQATAPYITELYNKYGCNEHDLYVISIDTGDSDAEVLAYEATYSGANPGPAVSGDAGGTAVVTSYGAAAFPTVVLIGADGLMKNQDIWPISNVGSIEAAFTSAGFSPTVASCSGAAGLEEIAINSLNVYPNPAVNSATVSVTLDAAVEVTTEVYNMVGALVASNSFNGVAGDNKFELNTTDLENGNYILKVAFGNQAATQTSLNVMK